jgi:hypothetical protein
MRSSNRCDVNKIFLDEINVKKNAKQEVHQKTHSTIANIWRHQKAANFA